MDADRAFAIHYAKIMLHECAARRRSFVNRNFYWLLFAGAQRARREAAAMQPAQTDLFGALKEAA